MFHDICTRSGLCNGAALAGLERGEHLSKEKIVSTNPDIFIFPKTSATKKGDVDKLRFEVLHEPSLATVKAVKNESYIVIADRYRYSASQYMADAILLLSKQAYPSWQGNIAEIKRLLQFYDLWKPYVGIRGWQNFVAAICEQFITLKSIENKI